MTIKDMNIGDSAVVNEVGGRGSLRQHFLDMGVIPGTVVTIVKYAPMGDPVEIRLHGYELTLRLADCEKITVTPCKPETEKASADILFTDLDHPGLGQGGIYHKSGDGAELPRNTILSFALVGNQNCGKTTLFNRLTGSNQHVGNFPGVTVDRKDGSIKGYPNTVVTDLPGIYSLSPYSAEEIVSRDFVLNEKPKGIINIVDATNIERNMYLTMQLLEMNIPMVIALNMMDEMTGNGGSIDINNMERILGVPVVPISAAKNQGIEELVNHAIHVAKYREKPQRQDFCDPRDRNGAVHRALHSIIHLIHDHAYRRGIPVRFAASKLCEGDRLILDKLGLDDNEKELLEHILIQMETESGLDRNAAVAEMRFTFIQKVCGATVKKPRESREHIRSQKIDKILTGKYTAIPAFAAIMLGVFYLTFNVIGAFFQGILESGVERLTVAVDVLFTNLNINPALHRLVIEGIFGGVGSVVSFLPIIVTLFFFLSLLEDSGYIARVAFVMDKLLRKIGLSGRSIVPMLIGFGCTVPAVMATRTLPSERDRKMTVILTPFMSCTAKLPIYAFFVDAFFPRHGGFVMTGLYLVGIVVGIAVAFLFKNTVFKGEAVPFVMELPNYRMPGAKNVAMLLWDKAKDFLQRAFTVILVATVVVWILQNFDAGFNFTSDRSKSILALVAGKISPIFAPIGLNDWRITTSLFTGFMAKESVVSTMEILFGSRGGVEAALSSLQAASLLIFSLLYTPCVAAVAAIKNEMGGKWAVGVVVWQCVVAWLMSFVVYNIGALL